jgi:hypothetical protein
MTIVTCNASRGIALIIGAHAKPLGLDRILLCGRRESKPVPMVRVKPQLHRKRTSR